MNRFIIFLFSLFVLSCTQSRLTPLQKWELANLHTKEEPSRGVAQLLNERCESTLDDEKSVALLVAQEELKRAKELFGKVTSTTAKKRLFEYFQANFSKYILSHPEHKECSSVDCLYASYYPKGGLEGIWSYIWWLRTGSILAISDTIPDVDVGSLKGPFKFESQELKKFAELALTTENLKDIKSLNAIYRLPPNMGWANMPGACGLASAKGWIQFIDTCMAEHYLKIALVHELAHHVDFSTDPKAVYGVSSRPDWLAFSGWRVEEFIDQNAANIVRRWVYDDKKEGFVTSYATTSPREDWAETMAFYRAGSKELLKIAPGKSQFAEVVGFKGEKFDDNSIINQVSIKAFEDAREEFLSKTIACASSTSASEKEVSDCLNSTVDDLTEFGLHKIRHSNLKGCRIVEKVPVQVSKVLKGYFSNAVTEASKNMPHFIAKARVSSSYLKALEEIDTSVILISCIDQANVADCYTKRIIYESELKLKPEWEQFLSTLSEIQLRYIDKNTLESAAVETSKRYRRMFSTSREVIRSFADQAWQKCSVIEPVSGDFGDLGSINALTEYVNPAIEKCLIDQVRTSLANVLIATVDSKFKIVDEPTRRFITLEFSSDYWMIINQSIIEAAKEEGDKLIALREQVRKELVPALVKETEWISEALPIEDTCKAEAQKRIRLGQPTYVNKEVHKLKFYAHADVILKFSEEACAAVATHEGIKVLFNGSRSEQMQASFEFLKKAAIERASYYMQNCQPGSIGKLLEKWELVSSKTSCAYKNSGKIVYEAFQKWEASPYGQKFASNKKQMWNYGVTNISSIIRQVKLPVGL